MAHAHTPPSRTKIATAANKRKAADRREADAARLREEADALEAEYRSFMASAKAGK